MEKNILPIALNKLKDQIPIDLQWNLVDPALKHNKRVTRMPANGNITLTFNGLTFKYRVEARNQLRTIHLPNIFELQKETNDLLVVAEIIYPNLRITLKERGINYIDTTGNVFIKAGNNVIFIEGKKTEELEKPGFTDRAFNKTGLILIFHLLHSEDFINLPYRDIAATYGIAVGNVTYILKNLEELGYVRKIENRNFKILNKEALLQQWIQNYPLKLKPALHVGNFNLFNKNIRDWKNLIFDPQTILWGAEPAASLLTDYLVPAELTIYTTETKTELIKNLKLIPDPLGPLKAYRKFWQFNKEAGEYKVPLVLVYADLVNSGDTRNIETAQMIYDKYIKGKL
jgi:hypothetical protein